MMLESTPTASYHSLQITAKKQMSHYLTMNGFYVYNKSFYSADPKANGLASTAQDHNALLDHRITIKYTRRAFQVCGT